MSHKLTRRRFLHAAGAITAGILANHDFHKNAAAAFWEALPPRVVRQDEVRPTVAIAQADSYDRDVITAQVQTMLDQIGGLSDIIRPGDRVAIKPNLTGGTYHDTNRQHPAIESYITHPEIMRALVAAITDAGAGEIVFVEGIYDAASWTQWGYSSIAREFNCKLIDLNQPNDDGDYTQRSVGTNWLVYDQFTFNPILEEVDVFISYAKLKNHALAGITLSMKNLIGLVPVQFYRLIPGHNYRSGLHGPDRQATTRLPAVIVDMNRARPIDLAIIDGIMTAESSEGPWNTGDYFPKAANVLLAGKNPVATDTVGAAVMGYAPGAVSLVEDPFRFCINHLELANHFGLGTNRLDEIEIVGAALEDVQTSFRPYGADKTVLATDEMTPFRGTV